MPDQRDVERLLRGNRERERERGVRIQAVVGSGTGKVKVPSRPGWVYVRLHGDGGKINRALNKTTLPMIEGLPVELIRRVNGPGGQYQISGISSTILYATDPITGFTSAHATQHMLYDRGIGGFDPVLLYARMIGPLRARAQDTPDMTVHVDPGVYVSRGVYHYYGGGNSPAFTAPGSGSRWDLLILNNSGALEIVTGTSDDYNSFPDFPTSAWTGSPLAFIYLAPATTAIHETEILDPRPFGAGGGRGGASGWAPDDASYVTISAEPSLSNESVLGLSVVMKGLMTDRPAAGTGGRLYLATDVNGGTFYRDNGSSWDQVAWGVAQHDDHGNLSGLSDDDHSQYILAAGTRAFTGDQSFGNHKPTNVADPTSLLDAANKEYVDTQIANIPSGGGHSQGSFIVTGGGVDWKGTNFDYTVAAASYYINGVHYTSPQTDFTLDPADTDDRIDVIVLNTSGAVAIVKGGAATNPSEPDIDPATQVFDSFVYVVGGSSTPSATTELIYKDDGGSGGTPPEWNWTTSGSGFNVASTNNPRGGSGKDIEGSSVANNAYAQGQRGTGTIDPNAFDQLVLYIRSKGTWNGNRSLIVTLLNAGVRKGNALNIAASGTWGFDSSNTTDYQAIIIPTLQFAIPAGTLINQLRITDSGGSIGFYIDDISFLVGGSGGSVSGMTQAEADARYLKQQSNLSDLGSAAAARTNLGLGTAATHASTDFAAATHHTQHQNGGGDEIATATPGANAIPKAGSGGQLAIGFLASGTPDGTKFVRDDGVLATPSGSGMSNPMTTQDDLIVGGASPDGTPTRLGKGSDGQVLTVNPSTHHLDWEAPAGGPPSGTAGGDLQGTYPNPTVNIDGKTDKATPADGDETFLADSAASFATKKLTWANLKATLKTYLDTLYATIASIPSGANPSAQVAGSAVNGSAASFMRSDAAPKLADTAVTPGAYGDGTHVAQVTVDQQGRVTAAATVAITGVGTGATAALSANAGWNELSQPHAVYYNGRTYIGYSSNTGDVIIRYYDHATKTLSAETVLHATLETDLHNCASILIRDSDKRIVVVYSKHYSNVLYIRISTNPEDISSFGAETNLASTVGNNGGITYPSILQLTGEASSPIYIIWRDINADNISQEWWYSKSTDGGVTWAARSPLYVTFTGRSGYLCWSSNGTNRIDYFVTDGYAYYDSTVSVYHFYYMGGSFYKTNGALISSTPPLQPSDLTKVFDGATYSAFIADVALGTDGNPVVTFVKDVTSTDHRYEYARWNGSSWVITELVAEGGTFNTGDPGGDYWFAGAMLDQVNPNLVYLSKKVGSQWEMYLYWTVDYGTNWQNLAITSGSANLNWYPNTVRGHSNDLRVIWLNGTFAHYTSWSATLQGWGSLWSDEKIKATSNDATEGYLKDKLVAGANVSITENDDGGAETLSLAVTGLTSADGKVDVSSGDTTRDYLINKLVAGANIALTKENPGGNETLQIDVTGILGTDHLHGLARWLADGSTTAFELPDLAEYLEWATDNGVLQDQNTVSLATSNTQLSFASAPTAAHVIQAEYVLQRI